jgi:Xaa-Pro aminopeptidase
VLLFDFGAQVDGYRSDMTRTLFVGDPTPRDLGVYETVAASQEIVFDRLAEAIPMAQRGIALPAGPELDLLARKIIEADGRWDPYGHGLGHGIGIATHELPSVSRKGARVPLPRRTVFSVEPGIYLEGETGVRIEDLVAIDADAGTMDILTKFPRDVVIVGR